MDRTRRFARKPAVEGLEGRELARQVGDRPDLVPVHADPRAATLAEHIHPFLTIARSTVSRRRSRPGSAWARRGTCRSTRTMPRALIHVESTQVEPFRLQDFFTIWGQPLIQEERAGPPGGQSPTRSR